MFNIVYYVSFVLYEELLYRIVLGLSFSSSIFSLLFLSCGTGIAIGIISNIIPKKVNYFIFNIFNLILCFYYGAALIIRKTFDVNISFSVLNMYTQFTGAFANTTASVLKSNALNIFLVALPFLIGLILTRKIDHTISAYSFISLILCYVLFLVSLSSDTYDLYFNRQNNRENVENFGVLPSLIMELWKGDSVGEEVESEDVEEEETEETVSVRRRVSDINFNDIETENSTVESMNKYFSSSLGTYTNDYTGLFEGKNLIYIMAESFDGYAVSKELTPTLYKMIHSGLYFLIITHLLIYRLLVESFLF